MRGDWNLAQSQPPGEVIWSLGAGGGTGFWLSRPPPMGEEICPMGLRVTGVWLSRALGELNLGPSGPNWELYPLEQGGHVGRSSYKIQRIATPASRWRGQAGAPDMEG